MEETLFFVPEDAKGAGGVGKGLRGVGGKPSWSLRRLTPVATGGGEHEGVVGDEVCHQRGIGLYGDEPLPFGDAVFVPPLSAFGVEDFVVGGGVFPEGFLEYGGSIGNRVGRRMGRIGRIGLRGLMFTPGLTRSSRPRSRASSSSSELAT